MGPYYNQKPIIVLIEDDEILSRIVCEELVDAGFHAVQAFDGQSGIDMVRRFHPAIILLDLILPRKSGYEVLAELKRNDDTRRIPVVVMTMLGAREDIEKSMRFGAEAHIVKSQHSVEDIVAKVLSFLPTPKTYAGKGA